MSGRCSGGAKSFGESSGQSRYRVGLLVWHQGGRCPMGATWVRTSRGVAHAVDLRQEFPTFRGGKNELVVEENGRGMGELAIHFYEGVRDGWHQTARPVQWTCLPVAVLDSTVEKGTCECRQLGSPVSCKTALFGQLTTTTWPASVYRGHREDYHLFLRLERSLPPFSTDVSRGVSTTITPVFSPTQSIFDRPRLVRSFTTLHPTSREEFIPPSLPVFKSLADTANFQSATSREEYTTSYSHVSRGVKTPSDTYVSLPVTTINTGYVYQLPTSRLSIGLSRLYVFCRCSQSFGQPRLESKNHQFAPRLVTSISLSRFDNHLTRASIFTTTFSNFRE